MRSCFLLPLFLVCLLVTHVAALKGVRGFPKKIHTATRSLQEEAPKDTKDKTCKKYKEPKSVKESTTEPKAVKEAITEPKAVAEPKQAVAEPKDAQDPKDVKEAKTGVLEALADKAAPKADKIAVADKADPKADAKAAVKEAELECLEWEEDREDSGSEVIEPVMGSSEFAEVNVDCNAIANGAGPIDTHSVSFSVNMDLVKDADSGLQSLYSAMEKELQTKVAPRIAGCTSGRLLSEESSKIVNIEIGEFQLDIAGCDSSLAKEAADKEGICVSSDIPVDVYFVGDFPANAIAKVEVAIEEHEWNVDGLLDTSEVEVVQTGSSMDDSEPNVGMIAGIAVAVLACAAIGFYCFKRSRDASPVAKAELDTDEESDDEKDKKKGKIQEVEAKPVGQW